MDSRIISDSEATPLDGSLVAARSQRRKQRQAAAWIASILFHVLLFVLCFSSLRGAAVSGGVGTDTGVPQAYWVSLAGLHGGVASSSASSQAELNTIFQRIRDQQSQIQSDPQTPAPKASLDKLFDAIDQQRSARDRTQIDAGQGRGDSQLDRGGSGSAIDGTQAKQPEKQGQTGAAQNVRGPGSAASTGDGLWGQIAPCWGRLPQVATVPVTLEITLNTKGQIATPPKIIRPGKTTPSDERLISEARALAAVSACMPYHVDGVGPKGWVFRVDFAKR